MKSVSNKIDLVVSFDTTGSMYPVLSQVRTEVEKFVHTMFSEFSDLKLGIIAHGDYCDKDNPYTIRVMDLTRDEDRLCKFVKETDKTYGGDSDECYELVLNTARKEISWRKGAQRVLVMIGDASPHGINYPQNREHLDWEEEAKQLGKEDVKIFSVHALSYYRGSSKGFYESVAKLSGGVYLTLDQFNEVIELIKATCYQQGGEERLNEYISIIRDNGKMTNSMDRNFRRLKGEKVEEPEYEYGRTYTKRKSSTRKCSEAVTVKEMAELEPVMPGRFQVMTVDENCDIKGFVTKNGIEFKKGRGFYELSKVETVQQYKEVIMQDKETGELFVGSQVREKLGLQPQTEKGGVNEKLYAKDAKEFRIFVQSTSVNRKLISGTTFLYEISDIEDTGTVVKEVKTTKEVKVEPAVDVKEPAEVEKKTTKTDGSKKIHKKVLEDKKFDEELAKRSLEKSIKPDTMTLAAAAGKKSGKTLKALAKDMESDKVSSLDDTELKDSKKTKKSRKRAVEETKVTKDTDVKTTTKTKPVKKTNKVETPKFSDVSAKGIKKPVVDEDMKAVKKELDTKDIKGFTTSSERVLNGVERFAKSQNKKNTEYLVNNLKKSIETAQKMLDSIQ